MIKNLEDHKKEEEKERQKLLQVSEVSLWLYGYDDIFSDFDPRPYSQRAVSEDFLVEARKISKEKKSGQLQLTFSVPGKSRDAEKEKTIKRRLKDHFKKHAETSRNEASADLRKGMLIAGLGLVFMFSSAIIRTVLTIGLWHNLLMVLLEPSGWFMAWYGFDKLIEIFRKSKPEVSFYERMAASEIDFISY